MTDFISKETLLERTMGRGRRRDRDDANGFGAWGDYFSAKKSKLEQQYAEDTAKEVEKISDIFAGVAILVNGLTNPNAEELKKLMAAHGGTFQLYQSSSTTHIVASNLPNVKINRLGSVPIVKPSWIPDSIELGKLLDYKRYLLYTNQSTSQPRLDFPVIPKNPSTITTTNQTKTASDPNFLEDFYNNSRLHLIATLGAEYKQLVSDWREKSDFKFPALAKLSAASTSGEHEHHPKTSVIMHIDMDCFFVSVGLRSRPELRGQPVAVTHARNAQINGGRERDEAVAMNLDRFPQEMEMIDGRSSMSEVASCSYEARKCGLRNGMFLGAAVKLCPDLKTIPYDFQGYKEVSQILYETVSSYTLDIEAVSCDEMYVDVTNILKTANLSVEQWSEHIRTEIMSKTACPCSTGFGANRLQARLATKKAKPAGSFHLKPEHVEAYMSEIPLSDIPGVGRATLSKLKSLGLNTCGDVQVASLAVLQTELGSKSGETLLEQARGMDKKPLNFHHERKSVSAEINYGIRFKAMEECHKFLESLSVEVWNRLSEIKMRARCVTLKLMVRAQDAPVETAKYLGHGICDSLSKSSSTLISDAPVVFREVKSLYDKLNVDFVELRGIGIQLTKLEKPPTMNPTLNKFLQQKSDVNVKKVVNEKKITREPSTDDSDSNNTKGRTGDKGKRGRPKGKVGNNHNNTKKSANVKKENALDKFFKSTKDSSSQDKSLTNKDSIDLEVLNSLPEDIRQEIMREYNIPSVKKPTPPPVKSPFDGLQWCQLRPILYEWFKNEEVPKEVDVVMLGEYFRQLAIDRKIDCFGTAFNFLYRILSDMNCKWHDAYFTIVNLTQQGMVARYGITLLVNRDFGCCRV